MIDVTRWVVAEAWLSNGLRLRWSSERAGIGPTWQRDNGTDGYRYAGYGEWEVAGGNYTNASYTRPEAPSLTADTMLHELAHWLVSDEEARGKVNFGLTGHAADDAEAEERALLAERVLSSVVKSAARIATMALGGKGAP